MKGRKARYPEKGKARRKRYREERKGKEEKGRLEEAQEGKADMEMEETYKKTYMRKTEKGRYR